MLSSAAALGAPAVLEAVGAGVPDAFRMYQDPSADTCEHILMDDTAWAQPVAFARGTDGKVASFAIPNWTGEWVKQA